MSTRRIIPCLDIRDSRVVKGINFVSLRDAGDPVELASFYEEEGADELVFLDITASLSEESTMPELVQEVASRLSIPLTVGGGIRSLTDMERLLQSGVSKISLNSAAVADPDLVRCGSRAFGSRRIVVAIDACYDPAVARYRVHTHGGRRATSLFADEWAEYVERLGAGEIILTSINRDGTNHGYDLQLHAVVGERVSLPVIASGGAGTLTHFAEVLRPGLAAAALAASVFHYGKLRIADVKRFLASQGVPVLQ